MNYVFYDLETTGRNSAWDQIIQVAAILTDDKFNVIDKMEERCRLKKIIKVIYLNTEKSLYLVQ